MEDRLSLKWGTLKAWNFQSVKAQEAFKAYAETPQALGAMQQDDTPEQKKLLCDLIDALDCDEISNDWSGEKMSKDEAKKYVLEYRSK